MSSTVASELSTLRVKNVLIAGATGLIGKAFIKHLIEQPEVERINLVVRRKPEIKHAKINIYYSDFEPLELPDEAFEVDAAYCLLGTTRKKAGSKKAFEKVDYYYSLSFARHCKAHHIPTMGLLTAMGSNSQSLFFYSRVKGRLEKAIIDLQFPCLYIFQPALLLGEREEPRFGETFAGKLLSPLESLFIGSWANFKPIPDHQVAKAIWHYTHKPEKGTHIMPSGSLWI